MPIHLRPCAPTARDAILCGDPSRALAIAQAVLPQPRMSNHHRGLWGYWGETASGLELTVQATGIGGPSAVTVLGELIALGVGRAIRVGTCTARGDLPALGSRLVVATARAEDGCSVALGVEPGGSIAADPELTAALAAATGAPSAEVVSRDLQPEAGGGEGAAPDGRGEVADLQTAATLAFAERAGISVAATLAVAGAAGRRLEDEPLEGALLELAAAAAEVLGR